MTTIINWLSEGRRRFRSHMIAHGGTDRGQALVEYAILIALMSIALVGALSGYRAGVGGLTDGITDVLLELFS